jgi:hypothetical protein
VAQLDLVEIGQRASRRMRLFGALLFALIVVQLVPLPWRLSGLGFGLLAMWTGIRLLSDLAALHRARQPAPGWLAVSVGLGLTTLITLLFVSEAVLYPLVAEQERCTSAALTHLAKEQCQRTLEQRIAELGHRLRSGG